MCRPAVMFKNNSAPDCFQQGLVERQILEVLHGLHHTRTCGMENSPHTASESPSQLSLVQEDGNVCRKMIQTQDVCPICQEELQEKQLPVSYCRCVRVVVEEEEEVFRLLVCHCTDDVGFSTQLLMHC